jgi:hypothetical protein
MSRPPLSKLLAAVAALFLLASGSAAAATGTISGRLGGLPGNAEFGAVEAVDAHGEIEGVGLTSPSGSYDLKVPTGTYVLAGSGTTEQKSYESVSAPREVRKGKTAKVSSALESTPLARPAGGGKGMIPKESILMMEGVLWRVAEGPEMNFKSYVLNELFRICSDHGMIFVANAAESEAIVLNEKHLADTHQTSTPFVYRPLKAQYIVLGVGEAQAPREPGEGFKYFFELGLTTATHLSIDDARVEVTATSVSYDDSVFLELVAEASKQFAAKVCG